MPSHTRRRFLFNTATLTGLSLGYLVGKSRLVDAQVPASTPLRKIAERTGRFYGTAISAQALRENPAYGKLIAAQCNIAVAENEFKWPWIEASFNEADKIYSFCKQNKIQLRGTTLVWYQEPPRNKQFPPTVSVFETHFAKMLARYNGDTAAPQNLVLDYDRNFYVVSWDIFNEILDPGQGREFGLRGPVTKEYVRDIFKMARTLRPKGKLCWNEDYGEDAYKHPFVLKLIDYLQNQGVTVDQFGIQAHLIWGRKTYDYNAIRTLLRELKKRGVEPLITELDVSIPKSQLRSAGNIDQTTARQYQDLLTVCLEEGIDTVLTWGITDRYTWLRNPQFSSYFNENADRATIRPLPFDENLQPKAAMRAIAKIFSTVPPTIRQRPIRQQPNRKTP